MTSTRGRPDGPLNCIAQLNRLRHSQITVPAFSKARRDETAHDEKFHMNRFVCIMDFGYEVFIQWRNYTAQPLGKFIKDGAPCSTQCNEAHQKF